MSDLAHVIEAITLDNHFDVFIHVRGIVEFVGRPRVIDIHCGTAMCASILRSFPGAVVSSVLVEDTDHDIIGLQIGCPVEEMKFTEEILVRCETLIRQEIADTDTDANMSQTLGDLLRQKFGDI
jgi:hypothetical protein